jgi:N-acetylglutamate synthase-like GNAT family acetyltransferase
MVAITARLARPADLGFVRQDGYIPEDVLRQKIDRREVFVAECDGALVGYARIEYLWSLVPYLSLISVLPSYRRRGAGRSMLRAIQSHLCSKGLDTLYSSSQADEPEPQAWHRHVGFAECGFIAGLNDGGVGEVFFRMRLR